MINFTSQNDTILKQLDKAVDLKSVKEVQVQQKQSLVKLLPDTNSIEEIAPRPIQSTVHEIVKPEIMLPEKKIMRDNPDWAIGVFILALIIFATVRLFFNKYLNQLFNAAINFPTSTRLFRERSLNILHGSFRLEVLFYIIFSYFVFQFGQEFAYDFTMSSFLSYLIILAGVLIYFIGKRIIYFLVGVFTESQASTKEYLFNFNQYMRVLGLILLPVSLIINFASFSNPRILFYFGIVLIVIVYLMSILRGARILLMKHFSISYLILYLCTLEILPLVFIYKLLLG